MLLQQEDLLNVWNSIDLLLNALLYPQIILGPSVFSI